MVKPAGALCNLDCPYCFYLHKTDLLEHERNARMSDAVLEQHIRQYLEANSGDEVVFSWQGGEPTVLGLPFFERVVQLQQRWRKPNQRIENDLQTNGILLDERWAAFLKAQGFVVGLSIDGPADLHDRYRPTKGGGPTHAKVMHAAALLREAGVPFAALCVVNREVAQRPLEVYRFLVDQVGSWRIQFTPCVESRGFKDAAPALTAGRADADGGQRAHAAGARAVRRHRLVGRCPRLGQLPVHGVGRVAGARLRPRPRQPLRNRGGAVAGHAGADVHLGTDLRQGAGARTRRASVLVRPLRLPRVRTRAHQDVHEGDLAFSPRQVEFGTAKHDRLPRYCRECPSLNLCWGECPKNRLLRTPDGERGLNYLCEGLKAFYARVARDMPALRRRLGR
jgi:uncharacterized protein